MATGLPTLDLHGVRHEDGEDLIETFITNNFQNMPVRIILGHSEVFRDMFIKVCVKYQLGFKSQAGPPDDAVMIVYFYQWQKNP